MSRLSKRERQALKALYGDRSDEVERLKEWKRVFDNAASLLGVRSQEQRVQLALRLDTDTDFTADYLRLYADKFLPEDARPSWVAEMMADRVIVSDLLALNRRDIELVPYDPVQRVDIRWRRIPGYNAPLPEADEAATESESEEA